jgi:hypothetical protein
MTASNDTCNLHLYGKKNLFIDLFKNLNDRNTKSTNNKNSIEIIHDSQLNIITKYYKTTVSLDFIENDVQKGVGQTDGVIIYLDSNEKILNQDFLEEFLKEKYLKLILVENLNNMINKNDIVSFSDEKDFNIIELNVNDDDDDDENGIDELINVLYVHEWSNIKKIDVLKEEKIEKTTKKVETNSEFEHILLNLQDFRDKASKLDQNERKLFAQDVVTKFWNSIGGDEEELEGLSDLSDIE